MTDSLKFGPEWLRMSSSTSNSSGTSSSVAAATATTNSAPRFPLSEFRYGREEMLALFDKNIKHPEILPRYKNLFVEKIQCPLALTPSAEDDQAARMWPMRSSPGLSVRGGRGGIMDRGRGRGRGAYHSVSGGFSRSSLFPEEEGGRAMGRGERWSDRNGTDPGEWASGLPSTSPRKEYNSHGRGTNVESWRRLRSEDDTPLEQWRSGSLGPREPTKWGRSTSWREEDSNLGESRGGYNDRGYSNAGMDQRQGGARSMNRRPWDVPEDNLPEWAVDNPLESGGSFDATGAFHGSDDELSPENSGKHNFIGKSHRNNKEMVNGGSGSHELNEQRPTRNPNHESDVKESGAGDEHPVAATNGARSAAEESTSAAASTGSPSNVPTQSPEMQGEEVKAMPPNVDRMQEVADDMVEKLIMDTDEEEKDKPMKIGVGAQEEAKLAAGGVGLMGGPKGPPPVSVNETEWFYRDPQDMVQGPFSAVEMAEWYQAGYFDNNLCVRRKNDQRFAKLGDLIEMCGGEMPFFVPYRALAMQVSGPNPVVDGPMKVPPILPHRINPGMMDMDPTIDPRVLRQNYIASQQALVYQKLSSSDMWHMLSPEQQRQMIRKHVAQLPMPDSIFGPPSSAGDAAGNMTPFGLFDMMNKPPPPLDGPGGVVDSAIIQQNMLAAKKMHQQRLLAAAGPGGPGQPHLPMLPPMPQDFPPVLNPADPLNQLMHNMRLGGFPQGQPSMIPPQQQVGAVNAAENDRIKTLLMQLSMQKGMQPPQQQGGGSAAALSQMMLNQQLQQQAQQQKPGMGPWPFAGGDPLKGPAGQQPLNMMGPSPVGGAGNWMGLEGGPQPPNNNPSIGDLSRSGMNSNNNPGTGGGIWELEHKLFSNTNINNNNQNAGKPIEMKTEKQIIEEQQMAAAAAAAQHQQQQQQEKEKELHAEQQKLQFQKLQADQQQQLANNETNDNNRGWTKVESKAAVGKVDVNQKDNKKNASAAEKEAKKKEAAVKQAQQQQQQQQGAKKEDPAKKHQANQEANKQQGKGKVATTTTPTNNSNNKSQSAKSGNNNNSSTQNNNGISNAKSVAPWSINQPQQEAPGLSLAEIQKLEMEQQRAEQARMDQVMQQQQQQWFDIQNLKADLPKWNAPQIAPSVVKSLAEIQAEEQAKLRQWQESNAAATAAAYQQAAAAAVVAKKAAEEAPGAAVWGSVKVWNNTNNGGQQQAPSSMGGFWEEPVKSSSSHAQTMAGTVARAAAAGGKTIAKSQTMSAIQSKTSATAAASGSTKATASAGQKGNANNNSNKQAASGNATTNGNAAVAKKEGKGGKGNKKDDASGQEFTQWCTKALSAYNSTIDIPTFVSFLQDIESPYEVKDYIRVYLGETKECTEFCKQFLERRSKYKNQIRAQNAHVDDMCSPAPALTPSSDFQEGKAKKVKKNKMMKLDSRILGFSVTAAQDRINVGDRDYPNAS